ncbi:hypothetical protein WJT86_05175 [Microvirga sp. W0021]|uniref:Uncharacterized protein n=1 Tax=Hohaiivirga grylli TaxID=3133970 RepID=A0ABV0BJX3_9HYPH
MNIRILSIVALTLCVVFVLVNGNIDGPSIEGPSPEAREYFKYIISGLLIAFIGYLAMTRR